MCRNPTCVLCGGVFRHIPGQRMCIDEFEFVEHSHTHPIGLGTCTLLPLRTLFLYTALEESEIACCSCAQYTNSTKATSLCWVRLVRALQKKLNPTSLLFPPDERGAVFLTQRQILYLQHICPELSMHVDTQMLSMLRSSHGF